MRFRALPFALALTAFVPTLGERTAHACGGTFCDGPTPQQPIPMPVRQSGENIVFALDGQTVEVHIQIQYTGDPRRFGWVVPLQKAPTSITVGSQALFTNLLAGTVPTFQLTSSFDSCNNSSSQPASSGGFGCGAGSSDSSQATDAAGTFNGTGGSSASGGGPGNVDVTTKRVGAFEVDLLTGGTAQAVTQWLTDNGYQLNSAADPIIAKYIDEGYVFAAVKLNAGESTKEIHPIVFRYPGNEPCVPLRLTSVAAEPTMGIRAFFLGDDRVVPKSYKHVTVSESAYDWTLPNPGQSYEQAVGRAVSAPTADGHAFVTDYYGPSSVVSTQGFAQPYWNGAAFANAAPEDVLNILANQGLGVSCPSGGCTSTHPLVLPLLEKWLPAPAGVSEGAFYACVGCYKAKLVPGKWDPAGFAKDFDERIVAPGNHALDLLARWPSVTRLYTTMSPELMTEDPTFVAQPGLPRVSPAHVATSRTTCDGRQGIELADGSHVYNPSSPQAKWPPFDTPIPAAAKVEDYSGPSGGVVVADNSGAIGKPIDSWNTAASWPPPAQFRDDRSSSCTMGRPRNTNLAVALGLLGFAGLLRRVTRRRQR